MAWALLKNKTVGADELPELVASGSTVGSIAGSIGVMLTAEEKQEFATKGRAGIARKAAEARWSAKKDAKA